MNQSLLLLLLLPSLETVTIEDLPFSCPLTIVRACYCIKTKYRRIAEDARILVSMRAKSTTDAVDGLYVVILLSSNRNILLGLNLLRPHFCFLYIMIVRNSVMFFSSEYFD